MSTDSSFTFEKVDFGSRKRDVVTGMLLSNVVMYFLILTTAATLNAHGHKDIETAKQAAEALRPLAGAGAYWLFTLGMIGTNTFGPPAVTDAGFSYDDLFGLMGTHQQCARTP